MNTQELLKVVERQVALINQQNDLIQMLFQEIERLEKRLG